MDHVVFIGGGFGGLSAAQLLKKVRFGSRSSTGGTFARTVVRASEQFD